MIVCPTFWSNTERYCNFCQLENKGHFLWETRNVFQFEREHVFLSAELKLSVLQVDNSKEVEEELFDKFFCSVHLSTLAWHRGLELS